MMVLRKAAIRLPTAADTFPILLVEMLVVMLGCAFPVYLLDVLAMGSFRVVKTLSSRDNACTIATLILRYFDAKAISLSR